MADRAPELFAFLEELKENNSREWFHANKARYEEHVKEPVLAFVGAFAEPLREVSPHMRADARPSGGSMFRIYRDTRFSKNKSPYKTHVGVQFRHKDCSRDVHTPGFYLHLEPGGVFGAAGIWRPDSASLGKIREAIVDDPDGWRAAIPEKLRRSGRFEGESLKRAPRGFDPEHPLIEDLKRKDFIVAKQFDQEMVTRRGFTKRYAEFCAEASPFMRFLTRALELDW